MTFRICGDIQTQIHINCKWPQSNKLDAVEYRLKIDRTNVRQKITKTKCKFTKINCLA